MSCARAHGHAVAGMLDSETQRIRTAALALIVVRPPDLTTGNDFDRVVAQNGRRRVAIVQRGSVDDRLEGGTRLAHGERCAVEFRLAIGKAADHSENTARSGSITTMPPCTFGGWRRR